MQKRAFLSYHENHFGPLATKWFHGKIRLSETRPRFLSTIIHGRGSTFRGGGDPKFQGGGLAKIVDTVFETQFFSKKNKYFF
jgi:hypothetical protein